MPSKNTIVARAKRNVERDKVRVSLPKEAFEALGITPQENTVIVTVYSDKVVITKDKAVKKDA